MATNDEWDLADPAPAKNQILDHGERCLWASVVWLAVLDAAHGSNCARYWLDEQDGTFSHVCSFLNLPECLIREHIEQMPRKRRRGRATQFHTVRG